MFTKKNKNILALKDLSTENLTAGLLEAANADLKESGFENVELSAIGALEAASTDLQKAKDDLIASKDALKTSQDALKVSEDALAAANDQIAELKKSPGAEGTTPDPTAEDDHEDGNEDVCQLSASLLKENNIY